MDCKIELIVGILDYDRFRIIPANRKVTVKSGQGKRTGEIIHRKELVEDLRKNGLINPLKCVAFPDKSKRVDGVFWYLILDGQHRAEICKLLNLPISLLMYSNVDDSDITNAQVDFMVKSLNSTSDNWTNKDFLAWDAVFRKDIYAKKFSEYQKTYKSIDITALYCILSKDSHYKVKEVIKSGTLTFEEPEEGLLENINCGSENLITMRKGFGRKGLRKMIINLALNYLFMDGYNAKIINSILSNPDNLDSINVEDTDSCIVSLQNIYKRIGQF